MPSCARLAGLLWMLLLTDAAAEKADGRRLHTCRGDASSGAALGAACVRRRLPPCP